MEMDTNEEKNLNRPLINEVHKVDVEKSIEPPRKSKSNTTVEDWIYSPELFILKWLIYIKNKANSSNKTSEKDEEQDSILRVDSMKIFFLWKFLLFKNWVQKIFLGNLAKFSGS